MQHLGAVMKAAAARPPAELIRESRRILAAGATRTETSWAKHVSDSYREGPLEYLPDPTESIVRGLSAAIIEAEDKLTPTAPEDVLAAMFQIAERKGLVLPSETLLDLDVQCVSEIPADLFQIAFKKLYRSFRWNRMPEVADWEDQVRDDWDHRKKTISRLIALEAKLVMKARYASKNGNRCVALPAPSHAQLLLEGAPERVQALLEYSGQRAVVEGVASAER